MNYLKNQSAIILSILASLTLLFTSCEKNDNGSASPQQNNFSENWGTSVKKDFMGKVVDEANEPISGVDIKIGQETAVTDGNGIFMLNQASVYERFAYITAEKAGYLKGSRSLVPTDGTNQVQIMLLEENIVGTVSSGSEGEVNLSNGTSVKFDGAFQDTNGNAYSGDVTVMMQHLASSDTDIDKKMPGMLYAQNANNEERVLETYGMINVELRGTGGQKLNIAEGHKAKVEFPIDPAQTSTAPSTIELWHFDEEIGAWIEEGFATKESNKYVGEVAHFSWWNCDAPFPTIKICIRIEDSNGNSITGVKVEFWRDGATFPEVNRSSNNGVLGGFIPKNETLNMVIYNSCGTQVYTSNIGPFSTDTNLTITIPSTPEIITSTITGTLLNCSHNPVTDGYVILNAGKPQELIFNVTNGIFNFTTTTTCHFTLQGVDNTNSQSSVIINSSLKTPSINLGGIIACDSVESYFIYQIDNNPPVIGFAALMNMNNIERDSLNYYWADDYGIGFWDSIDSFHNSATNLYIMVDNDIIGSSGVYTSPRMLLSEEFGSSLNQNIQFSVSNFQQYFGEHINMTFSGTYTDTTNVVRNITGTVHAQILPHYGG